MPVTKMFLSLCLKDIKMTSCYQADNKNEGIWSHCIPEDSAARFLRQEDLSTVSSDSYISAKASHTSP